MGAALDLTNEDILAFHREYLQLFIAKTFEIISPGIRYHDNWHIDCLAEYLMACTRGDIKRLIINVPPRSLKSISVNVAWPAWLLGKDPTRKIMSASYSKDLSLKHSVDCRHMMESAWYQHCFPDTRITDDNNQKSKYITTARGHRIATSVGATTTGEGGNFLIVDDPHSATEAQSKTIRESQNTWFDQSFSTRLNDKENDVIVVIMQRLHQQDLTGHLLAKGGWEHLCLPAMFEHARTITIGSFTKHIKAGECLHPIRESAKILEATKREMGSYAYAGQYMQTPVPDGGGIFKKEWLKLYPASKALPKFECIIQSYDTALTANTFSDATAFTVWGIFQPREGQYAAMLLDCWNERLEYPDLKRKVCSEWKTQYGETNRRADFILIEEKGSGISLIQDMGRMGIPVRKYNPGRADKVQRAHLVTYLFENGLVFFPESERFAGKPCSWTEPLMQQLMSFPNDEHDDYVDSTTQAMRLLRDMSWLRVSTDPDPEDREEKIKKVNPYGV